MNMHSIKSRFVTAPENNIVYRRVRHFSATKSSQPGAMKGLSREASADFHGELLRMVLLA